MVQSDIINKPGDLVNSRYVIKSKIRTGGIVTMAGNNGDSMRLALFSLVIISIKFIKVTFNKKTSFGQAFLLQSNLPVNLKISTGFAGFESFIKQFAPSAA